MRTENADRLAALVKQLAPDLKVAGFRKRRHTFNRRTPAGLVHVVNFQASPSPPPGYTDPLGWISTPVGQVGVNLGVFVPGMRSDSADRDWYPEYYCHLRVQLDDPPTWEEGRWWPVSEPSSGPEIQTLLQRQGLPWLDRFPDADAVLAGYRRDGREGIALTGAADVEIAALLVSLHRAAEAEKLLRPYLRECDHPGHLEYLADYLPTIGLGHLLTESGEQATPQPQP